MNKEVIKAPDGYKYEVVDDCTVKLVKKEVNKNLFYSFIRSEGIEAPLSFDIYDLSPNGHKVDEDKDFEVWRDGGNLFIRMKD